MPDAVLLLAVVGCGGLLGLQARVNGELGARVGSALDAATVSFLGGTLLLGVVIVATRRNRAAARRLVGAPTRWWWWVFGGVGGAAVVSATAEGVPKVGVALVTVCVVAGTAAGALGVDEAGLGPGGRRRITARRAGGAALAVASVALGAAGDRHAVVRPALFAVLFLAGAGSALQPAANGQLRQAAGSAWPAALVSFVVGTAVLVVAVGGSGQAWHRHWPHSWWLYSGGPQGVVFIVVAAALVHRLGVLAVSLGTVAGQLTAAVLLDAVWPAPGTTLRATTIVGTALTLLAVAIAARGAARPAPQRGLASGRGPSGRLAGTTPSAPDDTGQQDPRLADALAAGDVARVLELLPVVRLLVPVVAIPASGDAQMAVPALVNAAGRRALPVFSGIDALRAWQPGARPVPMPGSRVLAAAAAEGYDGLVVDVAGPAPVTLDRAVLAAYAPPPAE